MDATLSQIQDDVRSYKLDDALLFLNHVLGVARKSTSDPTLGTYITEADPAVFPHVVHFLAKQLLLNASDLGVRPLDWPTFRRLCSDCINLADPIQFDSTWKDADPSGVFERLLAQQLPAQNRNMLQKYGLALGLFRDVGLVEWPVRFSLRAEVESELGMTIDHFMGMGHVTFALGIAKHQGNKCIGTLTPMLLAEAFRLGIDFVVPEVWQPYMDRVTCDRDEFRAHAAADAYAVDGDVFEQFGFNPLRRFPITKLDESRYLAVDPELIVNRVTHGLFYDLFERNRTRFSQNFGYAFEKFIGQLIAAATPAGRLWLASEWMASHAAEQPKSRKVGDLAYRGDTCTVLIECKSMRPSLNLTTYGSEQSLTELLQRVASAVNQLSEHRDAINDGAWEGAGLPASPAVGVIVTYGKFFTINGPFSRKRLRAMTGPNPIPFVVLSLDELDMTLRLVEKGNPFDVLIQAFASDENSFDPLYKHREQLKDRAISAFTFAKGRAFMEWVKPGRPTTNE